MAREQNIVVRDFLGLCKTEREDFGLQRSEEELRANQYFGSVAENRSFHLTHGADSSSLSRPRIAIDHPLHNSITYVSKDAKFITPQDIKVEGIFGPALNGSPVNGSSAFRGVRHPVLNKAVSMQQLQERSGERSALNLPNWQVPYLLHPSQLQDIISHNQSVTLDQISVGDRRDWGNMQRRAFQVRGNHEADSNFMAQARRHETLSMGVHTQAKEYNASAYFSSEFAGTMPKATFPLCVPNLKEPALSNPALKGQAITVANCASSLPRPVGQQMPLAGSFFSIPVIDGDSTGTQTRMLLPDTNGSQSSAQLTIFYAGNVNVYDDISVDKAQALMLFAASGSSWPTKILNTPAGQCVPFGLSNAVTSESRPGSPQPGHNLCVSKQEKLQFNAQTGQTAASAQVAADQISQNTPPANKQSEGPNPNTPLSAPSPLPGGQPVVFKALPQARKASLARFLEKRKERVQSKSPYLMKKLPVDQSLLLGERFSSLNFDAASAALQDECVDKKSLSMSYGFEEKTGSFDDVSTCDMEVGEETKPRPVEA